MVWAIISYTQMCTKEDIKVFGLRQEKIYLAERYVQSILVGVRRKSKVFLTFSCVIRIHHFVM